MGPVERDVRIARQAEKAGGLRGEVLEPTGAPVTRSMAGSAAGGRSGAGTRTKEDADRGESPTCWRAAWQAGHRLSSTPQA